MIIDKEWRDKVFELLPWAQFITQDMDGSVVSWAEEPEMQHSNWYNRGDEAFLGKYLVEGDWTVMIFEREKYLPEGYIIVEGSGKKWSLYRNGEVHATIYATMNYTKAEAIEAFNRMVGE